METIPALPIRQPDFYTLQDHLETLWSSKKHLILAIEGKSGAGKTTLAAYLSSIYPTSIIHMDDFYLPSHLRTKQRLAEPGGNIHYERFLEEVHAPLLHFKRPASTLDWNGLKQDVWHSNDSVLAEYRVFSCSSGSFETIRPIHIRPLIIIEGAYCMRPEFRNLYNLSIFLDITPSLQLERLRNRVGSEALNAFEEKWIPLENRYIATGIPAACSHYYLIDR